MADACTQKPGENEFHANELFTWEESKPEATPIRMSRTIVTTRIMGRRMKAYTQTSSEHPGSSLCLVRFVYLLAFALTNGGTTACTVRSR
jgi:hypothetical protein